MDPIETNQSEDKDIVYVSETHKDTSENLQIGSIPVIVLLMIALVIIAVKEIIKMCKKYNNHPNNNQQVIYSAAPHRATHHQVHIPTDQ